ncbi:hypothetical protein [Candidatus Palauibacter sp.]|uniref:hypothetical protein n=1 Tax=Candidatus Palauibacter sp. TaxID=3101350 RepID=UPI003CC679D2
MRIVVDQEEYMAFNPDYGLRLKRDGHSSSVPIYLHGCTFYNIAVIGRNQYSTMFSMPYLGKEHAVSLDFGPEHLQEILARATIKTRPSVSVTWVGDFSPMAKQEVCPVVARLGQETRGQYEAFVPLIVESVLEIAP